VEKIGVQRYQVGCKDQRHMVSEIMKLEVKQSALLSCGLGGTLKTK
jgi:hypothetical protein